jgi:putative redox protein
MGRAHRGAPRRNSAGSGITCHLWKRIASLLLEALMEVSIQHRGDVKFEASARGHRVICDQPASNGGSDSGMTPPEFLLVSLGTFAGFYAAQYMKVRSLAHGDLEVKVSAEKVKQPARLGEFRIEVIVPGLDPQHHDGVLRAVNACLIHNTLIHAPSIETLVSTPVEACAG